MIIDIRGTHGSGKSTVIHTLLKSHPHEPILGEDNKIHGYSISSLNLSVVGKYETDCGGCDGVKTADEVCRRVREFSRAGNVILEGILVSHTFKRYSDLAHELEDYRFFFLNTPLKNCIARVRGRRIRKGNMKPFNPANLTKDWHQIWIKTRKKMQEEGHNVNVLNWKDPIPQIMETLSCL